MNKKKFGLIAGAFLVLFWQLGGGGEWLTFGLVHVDLLLLYLMVCLLAGEFRAGEGAALFLFTGMIRDAAAASFFGPFIAASLLSYVCGVVARRYFLVRAGVAGLFVGTAAMYLGFLFGWFAVTTAFAGWTFSNLAVGQAQTFWLKVFGETAIHAAFAGAFVFMLLRVKPTYVHI